LFLLPVFFYIYLPIIAAYLFGNKPLTPQVDFPKVLTAKDETCSLREDLNHYVYRKAVSKNLPTKVPDITDQKEFPKKI